MYTLLLSVGTNKKCRNARLAEWPLDSRWLVMTKPELLGLWHLFYLWVAFCQINYIPTTLFWYFRTFVTKKATVIAISRKVLDPVAFCTIQSKQSFHLPSECTCPLAWLEILATNVWLDCFKLKLTPRASLGKAGILKISSSKELRYFLTISDTKWQQIQTPRGELISSKTREKMLM